MDKKVERIIKLYSRLMKGEVINKNKEAFRFGVNERTIMRDIDDIRAYFANDMDTNKQLKYDRSKNGYRIEGGDDDKLTGAEVLIVCKVLLESNALVKNELLSIVDKLLQCCNSKEEKKRVVSLIANEKFHYENPTHGQRMVNVLWDIAEAIYEQRLLSIHYRYTENQESIAKIIQPAGIFFHNQKFYLTTYVQGRDEITDSFESGYWQKEAEIENRQGRLTSEIYCVNQILECEVLQEHFRVPYRKRFGSAKKEI